VRDLQCQEVSDPDAAVHGRELEVEMSEHYRIVELNGERWIAKDIAEGKVELVEVWSPASRLAAIAARRNHEESNVYSVKQHQSVMSDAPAHFSVEHPSFGSVSSHPTREAAMAEVDKMNKMHSLGKYAAKASYVKPSATDAINRPQWKAAMRTA
jgi:hypothetical protein